MRGFAALLGALVLAHVSLLAQDPLGDARRLYNAASYEEAERAARAAVAVPAVENGARVVLGRILLERFRQSASDVQLSEAREHLRGVNPGALDPRERIELLLGLAEGLYLEDRFAAAAEMFEPVITPSNTLGAAAHEHVLDWWAGALDHFAASRPPSERAQVYQRITTRMSAELERDPACTPANYWLVAAARGAGDVDGAWSKLIAAWLRAPFTSDRGAALRADLDRLVVQALIPERALKMTGRDLVQASAILTSDWESFKAAWAR
ncbi:MAG: hypothetical protein ABIS06_08245 [Vicinamibacterales bacterium]